MSELTYTRCGDYYIPDLKLSEQPEAPIGKYGRMRQRYLKEHRPGLYSSLILSEKLYPHLLEIDRAARERMNAMLPRMMEAAGVTEELKARDPMRWVGLMNTLKAQVEKQLAAGQNVVFDVDVVGGCNIKKFYGERALSVFIQPPSVEELRKRLIGRGTDAPEVIESRVAKAEYELGFAPKFDTVIVNDDLETAKAEALKVITQFLNR